MASGGAFEDRSCRLRIANTNAPGHKTKLDTGETHTYSTYTVVEIHNSIPQLIPLVEYI